MHAGLQKRGGHYLPWFHRIPLTTTHITGAGQRARQPAVRLNRRLKSRIDRSPRASWSQRGSWGGVLRLTAADQPWPGGAVRGAAGA